MPQNLSSSSAISDVNMEIEYFLHSSTIHLDDKIQNRFVLVSYL